MLGLLVVVDDTVLDVVVAQRILQVAQVVSHPLQLGFEIGDDVVRLAEPQVAVLLDELVVEDNQRVVDDGRTSSMTSGGVLLSRYREVRAERYWLSLSGSRCVSPCA